jgi:hypothetical protein
MKKLFYGLSSSRSLAKLFSMHARIEERRRVMFPKSSVFAVVALAAFVSLGALLLPQVAQAQCFEPDCDMGSDPSSNPWGNSPQSQLDIAYCIDQGCVFNNLTSILGPLPSASTNVGFATANLDPLQTCTNGGNRNVTISGPVVAWLKDASGNLVPGSPAQASLNIKIKCVKSVEVAGNTTLTRAVVAKELRTNVFDATSNITIFAAGPSIPDSLKNPSGWTGCPTNNKGILNGNCAFPVGIVEFNNNNAIAAELPAGPLPLPYLQGEVFRAQESDGFVGLRDCKGPPDPTPLAIDPATIQCSVGGGQAQAVVPLGGSYSGGADHTFNPTKGPNPWDIDISSLPADVSILPNPVFASANGGITVLATGCGPVIGQNVERCSVSARDLQVTCKTGDHVNLVVTGQLSDGRPFASTDPLLTCNNKVQ